MLGYLLNRLKEVLQFSFLADICTGFIFISRPGSCYCFVHTGCKLGTKKCANCAHFWKECPFVRTFAGEVLLLLCSSQSWQRELCLKVRWQRMWGKNSFPGTLHLYKCTYIFQATCYSLSAWEGIDQVSLQRERTLGQLWATPRGQMRTQMECGEGGRWVPTFVHDGRHHHLIRCKWNMN